jgi:hypothetical protein
MPTHLSEVDAGSTSPQGHEDHPAFGIRAEHLQLAHALGARGAPVHAGEASEVPLHDVPLDGIKHHDPV